MTDGGLEVVVAEHGGVREIFATGLPSDPEDLTSLHGRVRQMLDEAGAAILEYRVFGDLGVYHRCLKSLSGLYGELDWPLVLVQGDDCGEGEIAGLQIHAVAGAEVETVRLQGRPVGRVYADAFSRYCVLGGLQSTDSSRRRERQTRDTLEQLIQGLAAAGMDIRTVVRTWFFIDDILGWYPDFNGARSQIYTREGMFGRYLPASTGIGGSNPDHTAVVASALAIQGRDEEVMVREIPSPLQCPALSYGSSFSRAAELVTPDSRSVFVSGTASIDPDGNTVHCNDVDSQIAYTMEVVGAILESRQMAFQNITRGNAYFRDSSHAPRLEGHATRHGLPLSRVVISQNDVCREDLLFELEVEAIGARDIS